jgi:hypothetical protein
MLPQITGLGRLKTSAFCLGRAQVFHFALVAIPGSARPDAGDAGKSAERIGGPTATSDGDRVDQPPPATGQCLMGLHGRLWAGKGRFAARAEGNPSLRSSQETCHKRGRRIPWLRRRSASGPWTGFVTAAVLSEPTIKRFETGLAEVWEAAVGKFVEAFEAAGLNFIAENGGGAGVRPRKP